MSRTVLLDVDPQPIYPPDARIRHFPLTREAFLRRAAERRYEFRTPELPRTPELGRR